MDLVVGVRHRRRVLHVFADPATGVKLVAGIAEAGRSAGYEVEFACNRGEFTPQLLSIGLPVHHVPISRQLLSVNHMTAFFALWRLMRRRRYDIVHTHTPIASFLGRVAAGLAGVRAVIYHMRGSAWERSSATTRVVFTVLEWIASRWTDAILTVNCDDAADVVSKHIAATDMVECLHCGASGLDLAAYEGSTDVTDLRASLGAGPDHILIGFIGRFVREKGIFDLLDAFERVSDVRARLVLIGGALSSDRDQSAEREITEIVRRGPLAARITVTGFRDDIPHVMHALDIVVQPSYREGFANILAEAAAAGRPVVGANTRGVREVVVDRETGLIVPVADSVALAGAIELLLQNAQLRCEMGKAGRRRAAARFERSVPTTAVLRWYETLCSAPEFGSYARVVKRALDIIAGSLLMIVTLPVMILAAIVVRLGIGSPVLFRQERPGRGGTLFSVLKFRTMTDARDANGMLLSDFDRRTFVGEFLRRTSIDELPQLVNVLRGEMSLVGPRPLLPEYLPLYSPRQARRHAVRPGITGLAQTRGRNATVWRRRLALDTWYVENVSLRLDAVILWWTVRTVLAGGGELEDAWTLGKFRGPNVEPDRSGRLETRT